MVNLPAPPYSYETGKTSATGMWKPGPGNGRVVKGITIHHWGSTPRLDFDGTVNFLCSYRPKAPTSAHYVAQGVNAFGIRQPRVACIVDPDDIAYACGNWDANLTQISIECRPECTPEDQEIVAQLIARLWNQYGYLPLVGHRHWVADDCPGDNWMAVLPSLEARAHAILNGAAPAPAPAPKPAPAPAPPTPTGPRITVANLRPGYSNADVIVYNKLLWAAMGPVYKAQHLAMWMRGSSKVYDSASEQVTYDLYAWLHQKDPLHWGPPPSRPVWPGPALIRRIGGTPV